jgi:hypothetical protein
VRIWSLEDSFLTEDLSASSPHSENANEPVEIVALSLSGLTAIVRDITALFKKVDTHEAREV